jgi:hypothetical protein
MFLDQFKTYDASGWAGTCGLVREAADSLANNTKRYFVTIQPAQISEVVMATISRRPRTPGDGDHQTKPEQRNGPPPLCVRDAGPPLLVPDAKSRIGTSGLGISTFQPSGFGPRLIDPVGGSAAKPAR